MSPCLQIRNGQTNLRPRVFQPRQGHHRSLRLSQAAETHVRDDRRHRDANASRVRSQGDALRSEPAVARPLVHPRVTENTRGQKGQGRETDGLTHATARLITTLRAESLVRIGADRKSQSAALASDPALRSTGLLRTDGTEHRRRETHRSLNDAQLKNAPRETTRCFVTKWTGETRDNALAAHVNVTLGAPLLKNVT